MRSPARQRAHRQRARRRGGRRRAARPAAAGGRGAAAGCLERRSAAPSAPNAARPGTASATGRRRRSPPRGPRLEAQHAVLDDRAHAAADVELRAAAAAARARAARRRARRSPPTGAPAASSARRITTSRASAGGSARQARERDPARARRARRRRPRRAPRPRRAGARRCAAGCASAAGCTARSSGEQPWRTRPRAKRAASSLELSSRQRSPRARQWAAVCSRVTASSGRTSRPSRGAIPSSARRPGRGGEAVENGLDLVGGGVAGRDQRAAPASSGARA